MKQAGYAALAFAALLALPSVLNSYGLSIAIAVLYLAYVGQAWNLLMGFAGQLSLGHALYVGVGAYTAAALFEHHSVSPAFGACAATLAALALGSAIGGLAFRFRVSGAYFAVLTLAFSECTRIAFDHLSWTGGPAGLFLKVAQRDRIDLWNLRGPPAMYYYTALLLAAGALLLCSWLARTRAGFYWRAIREDEQAAAALGIHAFPWKMLAMALSAALTGIAGVFLAFYRNSLFPEQVFDVSRSIEIVLAPIIGGLGTLFGPVVGALVLTLLGEGSSELLTRFGVELPGVKQVLYGGLLLVSVSVLPQGIWPALARGLGIARRG